MAKTGMVRRYTAGAVVAGRRVNAGPRCAWTSCTAIAPSPTAVAHRSTRTTRPRGPSAVSGSELSQTRARSSAASALSGRCRNNVLDLRHVAPGGLGGLVPGGPALAGVQVRRVPIPPVVRRGGRLEDAVTLGGLVQQLRQSRDVPQPDPAGEALRDLLQQPAVAVRIGERREAAIRLALRIRARLVPAGAQAAPVPDLADVRAVADQVVPGGLDVIDDQIHVLHRAGRHRRQPEPELDRSGRARRGELYHPVVLVDREVSVEPPPEARVEGL